MATTFGTRSVSSPEYAPYNGRGGIGAIKPQNECEAVVKEFFLRAMEMVRHRRMTFDAARKVDERRSQIDALGVECINLLREGKCPAAQRRLNRAMRSVNSQSVDLLPCCASRGAGIGREFTLPASRPSSGGSGGSSGGTSGSRGGGGGRAPRPSSPSGSSGRSSRPPRAVSSSDPRRDDLAELLSQFVAASSASAARQETAIASAVDAALNGAFEQVMQALVAAGVSTRDAAAAARAAEQQAERSSATAQPATGVPVDVRSSSGARTSRATPASSAQHASPAAVSTSPVVQMSLADAVALVSQMSPGADREQARLAVEEHRMGRLSEEGLAAALVALGVELTAPVADARASASTVPARRQADPVGVSWPASSPEPPAPDHAASSATLSVREAMALIEEITDRRLSEAARSAVDEARLGRISEEGLGRAFAALGILAGPGTDPSSWSASPGPVPSQRSAAAVEARQAVPIAALEAAVPVEWLDAVDRADRASVRTASEARSAVEDAQSGIIDLDELGAELQALGIIDEVLVPDAVLQPGEPLGLPAARDDSFNPVFVDRGEPIPLPVTRQGGNVPESMVDAVELLDRQGASNAGAAMDALAAAQADEEMIPVLAEILGDLDANDPPASASGDSSPPDSVAAPDDSAGVITIE